MPQDHKKFIWASIWIVIGLIAISAGFYTAFHGENYGMMMPGMNMAPDQNPSGTPGPNSGGATNNTAPANVTELNVKNATYSVWNNTENVTLVNGQYTDNTAHISSTLTNYAIGDINHDGLAEALAAITTARGDSMDELFLVVSHGGQITTSPLAVPLASGQSVRNINSIAIASNGLITLGLSILGPNDPHCCASIKGDYTFTFDGKNLVKFP